MPFDPDLPADHAPNSSAQMRGQLTGLKELLDALAAGQFAGVVIDGVTTLDPGQPATVTASVAGGVLHLGFGIPRGDAGATGEQGTAGEVTTAALEAAIGGTARNPANTSPMSLPTGDPILLMIQDRFNELLGDVAR